MVAIVAGIGLGIERGSNMVLGSRGQLGSAAFGRNGENVFVNAATGNLVINRTDEILIGQGPDDTLIRSYNSLDGQPNNWVMSAGRHIGAVPSDVNHRNSTVTRYDWDGSDTLYTYDVDRGLYVSNQGSGPYDTLSYDETTHLWSWTDGGSRTFESYDADHGGRIRSSRDTDGNKLSFDYDSTSGLLTTVTTTVNSGTAETTTLVYDGSNRLKKVVTGLSGGASLTRTYYRYDGSGRLSTVTTDLTPDDNSISDGKTATVTYEYDSVSGMVKKITQNDGAKVEFTYVLQDGVYRVHTVKQTTDSAGNFMLTTIDYDTVNDVTTITDQQGNVTKLTYDSKNQLRTIELGVVGGVAAETHRYTYTAKGDVASYKIGAHLINYTYDDNGNLTKSVDNFGDTCVYSYGGNNELLTETKFALPDVGNQQILGADKPMTTRYAYDAENHLRFVVSALGEVTEYQYYAGGTNGDGNGKADLVYRNALYNVGTLAWDATITEASLSTWASSHRDATLERMNYSYDFRGNVTQVNQFSACDANGAGDSSKPYTRTSYVYDQYGNLLSKHTTGLDTEAWVYDGLGRVVSQTFLNGSGSTVNFKDTNDQVVVTLDNGQVQTSTYDLAGRLINYAVSGPHVATTNTIYTYDNLGKLISVEDPAHGKSFFVYDNIGRKIADIAADGGVTEYRYNIRGDMIFSVKYATQIDTSGLSGDINLNTVRPPRDDAEDLWQWNIYDNVDRLVQTIDGNGAVVMFEYDGASRLVKTTAFVNPTDDIGVFRDTPPMLLHTPDSDPNDRITRTFYDNDGRLIGTLDPFGYMTETKYNGAGEKTETVAYQNPAAAGLRASGSFDDLVGSITKTDFDQHDRYFYDGRGLLAYSVDNGMFPTAYVRDGTGAVVNTIEYAGKLTGTGLTFADVEQQTHGALAALADNRSSYTIYDDANRLIFTVDSGGTVTKYNYNTLDQVTRSYTFATRTDVTDVNMTTIANWTTSHWADGGNRVTWYYRDEKGRVNYQGDVTGHLIKFIYDADDRVSKKIEFADPYTFGDATTLATLDGIPDNPPPTGAIITRYVYDPSGRVTDTYNGLNIRTHVDYDALGRMIAKTEAKGVAGLEAKTVYTYDAAGNLATDTDPSNTKTTYTYNSFHQVTKKEITGGALKLETDYAYDIDGRLTNQTEAANTPADKTRTQYNYNRMGVADRYEAADDASYKILTHYDYDVLGRVWRETAGANDADQASQTTYVFNAFGEVTERVDAANVSAIATKTVSTYDLNGHLKTQLRAANGTAEEKSLTTYTYTAFGEVLDITEASGVSGVETVTHHEYDVAGRLTVQIRGYNVPAEQSRTTYAYDGFGRVVDRVDGAGTLTAATTTHYVYDLGGRVKQEWRAYTKPEQSETTYDYDVLNRVTDKTIGANNSGDASKTHYDYDGVSTRVKFENRGVGKPELSVTYYQYDALGRLSDRTDGYNDSAVATVTHYDYDGMSRVAFERRGYLSGATEKTTTQFVYDHLGRLIDKTVAVGTGDAVRTHYGYDLAGHLTLQNDDADGIMVRTQMFYDQLGRMIDHYIAKDGIDEAHIHYDYDRASHLKKTTEAEGITVTDYSYDALDRVTQKQISDATHPYVNYTTYAYDRRGNVILVNQRITASTSIKTAYQYDALDHVILTTVDPAGANQTLTYSFYDGLGRKTLEVDAENYATETFYNTRSDVKSVTRYAQRATGTFAAGDRTTVVTHPNVDEDGTTSFVLDNLGRVKSVTDAMSKVESYLYNVLGQRTQVTNRLNGTAVNTYDDLGRLVSVLQHVAYTFSDGAEADDILTTYGYDARGNRTQMVEGNVSRSVSRTTTYTYDALDRLRYTIHDSMSYMNQADFTTGSAAVQEELVYDRRGNIIESDDALGARTLFFYDDANRKIAQVDALKGLTQWTYDAAGNVKSVRSYDTALTDFPDVRGAAPTQTGTYRETLYNYDSLNRLTSTVVADVYIGRVAGQYLVDDDKTITISTQYAGGTNNVYKQTDGNGYSVYYWYDKLGRKTAQLDQDLYLTTYLVDADGNVTTETRFALQYGGTIDPANQPSMTSGDGDRVTTFEYDRNGRRITESRQGVAYVTLSQDQYHKPVAHTGASIVRYEYNALGEVTKKTEASGDYTLYFYDTQGRQTAVKTTPFLDWTSTDNVPVTDNPLTEQHYDALNNLTRTIEQGPADHVTEYTYEHGRLLTMKDANLNVTTYYYDKTGRTVLTAYQRKKSDGSTVVDEGRGQHFDALGRVNWQSVLTKTGTTGAFWNHPGDIVETVYNTHGDVIQRKVNTKIEETNVYNNAGWLVKSNSGDGVLKLYINDNNGNQTAVITSSGDALPAGHDWATLDTETAVTLLLSNGGWIDTASYTGMAVTINVYDERNLKTETWQTLRKLTSSGAATTLKVKSSYNAFGEALTQTDARNNVTTFVYNTLGKMVERKDAATVYTDDTGVQQAAVSQSTFYGYDLSGRLIGVTDANQNWTTRVLQANTGYGGEEASVAREYHADLGVFTRLYDVFGDLRMTVDEIGIHEEMTYDKMGNLLTDKHNAGSSTMELTDTYVYDSLGQRVKHYNSQFGSTHSELTDYDSQGRVISTQDMGGFVTGYAYAWNAGLTTGLGTFGGWTKTTTSAAEETATANRSMTESSDYYGRMVAKSDYGHHTYTFTYDAAGRLTERTDNLGEDVVLSYFNTGALATQTVKAWTATISTTSYGYDANGNRLRETMVLNGVTVQDMTVVWDAMNRMTSLNDPVSGTNTDPVSIAWEYDKVGNVRHTTATYKLPGDTGGGAGTTAPPQDYWYKYDSMNRVVLSKGKLVDGIRGHGLERGYTDEASNIHSDGMSLGYDKAGNRQTMVFSTMVTEYQGGGDGGGNGDDGDGGTSFNTTIQLISDTVESYTYDGGYLKKVHISESAGNFPADYDAALYTRDKMGRVVDYVENTKAGAPTYSRHADYNYASQVYHDRVDTHRDNATETVSETTYYYETDGGLYQGGAVVKTVATNSMRTGDDWDNYGNSITTNTYTWWDQALVDQTDYDPDNTHSNDARHSDYQYDLGGNLNKVIITDGYPRTVYFANDADGHVIRRFEDNSSRGDPTEYRFYFDGMQVGAVGNNGTANEDYAASIAEHRATATGPFRGGSATSIKYADFDQSYDAINGLTYQNTAQQYTVNSGDTLQSIAQTLWGDGTYWYLLADANGLNGSETLTSGMQLVVPNTVHNSHNNADTFRPYDPNVAQGSNFPSAAKPSKAHGGCGVFGQILMIVVAIAVAAWTAGALAGPMTSLAGSLGFSTAGAASMGAGGAVVATASAAEIAGSVAAGVLAGAASSIVSQGVGIAIGAQSSFNWGAVGMAAIGGGVGAGLGTAGAFSSLGQVGGAIARGIAGSVITQGVGVATGLQKSFDWGGVASAGLSAGVSEWVGGKLTGTETGRGILSAFGDYAPTGANLITGMASLLVNATTRTLINGSDFGDNIMAGLPDVIGQTVVAAIGDAFAANPVMEGNRGIGKSGAPDDPTLDDGGSYLRVPLEDKPPTQSHLEGKYGDNAAQDMKWFNEATGTFFDKDGDLQMLPELATYLLNHKPKDGQVQAVEADLMTRAKDGDLKTYFDFNYTEDPAKRFDESMVSIGDNKRAAALALQHYGVQASDENIALLSQKVFDNQDVDYPEKLSSSFRSAGRDLKGFITFRAQFIEGLAQASLATDAILNFASSRPNMGEFAKAAGEMRSAIDHGYFTLRPYATLNGSLTAQMQQLNAGGESEIIIFKSGFHDLDKGRFALGLFHELMHAQSAQDKIYHLEEGPDRVMKSTHYDPDPKTYYDGANQKLATKLGGGSGAGTNPVASGDYFRDHLYEGNVNNWYAENVLKNLGLYD